MKIGKRREKISKIKISEALSWELIQFSFLSAITDSDYDV